MTNRIYSPSQCKAFLTCEWLWKLEREGWRNNQYGKNTLFAIRGSAVSAGADAYHRGQGADVVYMAVKDEVRSSWEKERISSREFTDFKSSPLTQEEIIDMACTLVQSYMGAKLPYTVLKSEYEFSNHGRARADIIGKLGSGLVLPIDLKTKTKPAQPFYEYLTKRDFAYDHQLLHYCWALSEETGVQCRDYGIVILWEAKKPIIEYIPFSVTQERMDLWWRSAKATWAKMEQIELGLIEPSEASLHKSVYGPCPMYKACLEYNRNTELMNQSYFKVLR